MGTHAVPKICYFPSCGRAEFIKILLEYVQQKYEFISPDIRSVIAEGKLAFDQYPLYIDTDGFELVQSGTIIRYLAKKYELYPEDPKQCAIAEMIVDGVMDFLSAYFKAFIYIGDEQSKEAYRKHILPKWLTSFNKIWSKHNKRGDKFIFSDMVTFADLVLFQGLVVAEESVAPTGILHKFPILHTFYVNVLNLPQISDFLRSSRHLKALSN
eukprot:Phypoly_transcript_17081.p1 GENE.Phypoly_transcript_17081~~Phypoly_transcript_17081.p1  ORF type:complete len:212 (+),score=13.88 Phypoly_transcript_17081:134-769(+)